MLEKQTKLAIIINTASYERVSYALDVANAAASLGSSVSVLFSHGGIIRLKKGSTERIGKETTNWLKKRVSTGVRKESLSPVSESLSLFRKLEGKVYACPAAMELHDIVAGDLIEGVEVRSLVLFLQEDAERASLLYV